MIRYIVRCAACGATEHVAGERGKVSHVTATHEDDCPFFLALEKGQAAKWVEAHGYPISCHHEGAN